jgi:hypothetical protein
VQQEKNTKVLEGGYLEQNDQSTSSYRVVVMQRTQGVE